MAGYDISVGIGVEGESRFKKALVECQNSVKQLDSALKANAAEYDANADALAGNADRARLLAQSIELQKRMVQGLGQAVEYSTKEYGEASSQTTKYVLAQNKAREAVAKMEKELADMDREMEEVGRDSQKVGRQIETGIGDGAENAAEKLAQMMGDIRGELSSIGSSVGITATIDVIQSVGSAIQNIDEQTQEYRRTTSYLEQNAKDAGQAWADIEQHMIRVAAQTGGLEEASEGISNLLAAGLDSKEVADSVNMLLGAVIKFPDTYKFESLAESLRNTIEERKAVGQFGELLLALGVDIETFDKAMEKASDDAAAQDIALGFGANRGLEKTISEYEKANEQLLAGATAALEYQGNLSKLAEQMNPIGTAYSEMATATVSAISALFENTPVDEWAVSALQSITATIKAIEDIITGKAFEEERQKNKEIAETIEERTGLYSEIEAINQAIAEADAQGEYQRAYQLEAERAAMIKQIAQEATKIEEESAKTAGETVGESITTGMETTIEEETPEVKTATHEMMVEVNDAIVEDGTTVVDNMATVTDGVQAAFDSVDASGAIEQVNSFYNAVSGGSSLKKGWNLNSGGGGQQESGNPALQISMYMSETKVAEAIVPAVNRSQGYMIDRIDTLNA